MKVSTNELANAVVKELNRYTEEVENRVAAAVIEVGNLGANELRSINQVEESNVWKHYPTGWTTETKRRKGQQTSEIHNKTYYRLTHLLENGHVIKNGTGRTYGDTRKFPHIAAVDKKSVELLDKKIREAIEG